MTKTKTWILLFLIIALGFFLRTYHINSAPPGVYPDEAVNGMDAINAMHGQWQWFYPANNGREGLFMNLIAICFKLFGISVLTLKLPSIIFGTLAILGTFFLTKELFRSARVGLISAFLVSVSFWAINFSRISFRANMVPTLLVFSFYFLFKGLRTKKWYDFAIGGLIFGLGLHTYIAFRIAPLILIVALFFLILSYENFLKNYWKQLITFVIFAALSAAPMFYTFFYAHPEYWASRTSEISILNPTVNQGHLLLAFGKTFGLALAKYNFWGDQNWRHNFPPYPLLDPLTGIAFLFGIIYAIIKFFRLTYLRFSRKIRDPKLVVYATLLAWFFAMLVPEVMGMEGNPHALRAIGTLPVVFIFAALTFNYFFVKAERHSRLFQKIAAILIILMLISIGVFNSVKYHLVWAKKPETAKSFEKNLMDISAYLKTLPASQEKFIIAENMQRIPIELFGQNIANAHYIYHSQAEYISPKDPKNFIIIETDGNQDTFAQLQKKFPALTLKEKKDNAGISFYILK